MALCSSSDNWELLWRLGAQRSRTSMLPTQWRLHAVAFYDHLDCTEGSGVGLHSVTPNATSMSQTRRCRLGTSDIGAQLPFHLRCYKLPPMCRCPTSLSVWHYLKKTQSPRLRKTLLVFCGVRCVSTLLQWYWTFCFKQERTLPYVIGLTGSTASGKSSVCTRLERLGAVIIDCDKLGKFIFITSITALYCCHLCQSHIQNWNYHT